jgi:hypothetical protein
LSGPAAVTFGCGTGKLTAARAARSDIGRAAGKGCASENPGTFDVVAMAGRVFPQPAPVRDTTAISAMMSDRCLTHESKPAAEPDRGRRRISGTMNGR